MGRSEECFIELGGFDAVHVTHNTLKASHVYGCVDRRGLMLSGKYVRLTMIGENGEKVSMLYSEPQWLHLLETLRGVIALEVSQDNHGKE